MTADMKRTRRAREAATATMLQRNRRLQQVKQDIAKAEIAEKRAVSTGATARGGLLRSKQADSRDPSHSDTPTGRHPDAGPSWCPSFV